MKFFRGYDFTGGGVEFSTVLLIFEWALQQCSAAALPVIVSSNQRDAFPVAANKYRIDISNGR